MEPLYKKFSKSVFDEKGRLVDFSVECPENFNFAYDVVDEIAKEEPDRTALIYCNEDNYEHVFSFKEISDLSSKAANYLVKKGIKKGDNVMLILKRNFEYWYTILALHKIGAVAIPATHMLKTEDIVYRVNCIGISSIICTGEDDVSRYVAEAKEQCSCLKDIFLHRKYLLSSCIVLLLQPHTLKRHLHLCR